MSIEEARATVVKGSVKDRAAAARELGLHGTWDDVALLAQVAWSEKKATSVKLYCAAAAADLAARRRGAHGQTETLTKAQKDELVQLAFGGDPGHNPSMLMLASAADPAVVLARMGRIVRDPRQDVRLGATTALRRMVLSAVGDPQVLMEPLAAWMADPKVPGDTKADLARLAGEAGLGQLRDVIMAFQPRTEVEAGLRDTALDRLDARLDPSTWQGVWHGDGLDIYERAEAPRDDELALMGDGVWWGPAGTDTLTVGPEGAMLGDDPARMVWANPLGSHDAVPHLIVRGRVFKRLDDADLVALLDARGPELADAPEAAIAGVATGVGRLEKAARQMGDTVLHWLRGEHEEALAMMASELRKKRPKIAMQYWQARVLADMGRADEAREAAQAFLERAKPKDPHRADAEAIAAG